MNSSTDPMDRIVVGIDGSDYSTHALQTAATFASALKLRLDVISCWSRSDIYFAAQIPVGGFPEADLLESEATRLVDEALERAFGPERPTGLSVGIRYGHPAQILVEASANARMLVVGRRGRGGFLGLRIGSVSSACVAHARCPVVVVNNPE
ncbi:universal stress protein [Arthrobacter wenxiniae]|jgi:nucleotide-binding universal stress UspA family protein|uniref:Universal stress protein n=1 Tax=Arthrobacter wenxiniae TaxID=2713570 RepID=A0A7Y7IEX9_9MICC|nr:universal stress protein [Arthrobacter wenxiniae]NVM94205.1 universal stress protein [Arthrobacter wenxiniae]